MSYQTGVELAQARTEIQRLRAELAEAKAFAVMEHTAWQTMNDRCEIAEAAIARVRELCTESWAGKLAYDARMNVIRALEGEQT